MVFYISRVVAVKKYCDSAGLQPNCKHHWQHRLEAHCSSERCTKEKRSTCGQSCHWQACALCKSKDEGMFVWLLCRRLKNKWALGLCVFILVMMFVSCSANLFFIWTISLISFKVSLAAQTLSHSVVVALRALRDLKEPEYAVFKDCEATAEFIEVI